MEVYSVVRICGDIETIDEGKVYKNINDANYVCDRLNELKSVNCKSYYEVHSYELV